MRTGQVSASLPQLGGQRPCERASVSRSEGSRAKDPQKGTNGVDRMVRGMAVTTHLARVDRQLDVGSPLNCSP